MTTDAVDNVLRVIREHLGLDVAFVAQLRETDRDFRNVPVRLADGRIYGTLCCLSFSTDPARGERDLRILQAFAALLGSQIDRDLAQSTRLEEARARITAALRSEHPTIVYQPIYHLKSGRLAGLECLSRFSQEPDRPPDQWFAEAAEVGMGPELELAAMRRALEALPLIPPDAYLSVNCSPQTILDAGLRHYLQSVDLRRVVLEITEHDYVHDYPALLAVLAPLRALGLRLAIDDAGAGYASLQHVLNFQPDKIKLDISLTKNLDADPKRRALASALIAFGREIRSHIVAEGVETAAELATLMRIGVDSAQGYFLARPMPLMEALGQTFPAVPAENLSTGFRLSKTRGS